jgi:hypothetical protein
MLIGTSKELKLLISKEVKTPEIAANSDGFKIPTFLIIVGLVIIYKLFCGEHFKRQVDRMQAD